MSELAARLRTCSLFKKLSEGDLEYLAALTEVRRYPEGTAVIRQGDYPGDAFYVVLSGQLEVRQTDKKGMERSINYHTDGHYFGERSLLADEPRAATVRAIRDTELVAFDKSAFDQLCSRHPNIKNYLIHTRVDFPGRQQDEIAEEFTRRHPYSVIVRFLLPVLVLVFGAGITLSLLLLESPIRTALPWAWVVFATLWLLWAILLYIDWINDTFIVSTKRVIHIERVLFLRDERYEAPIDQVISVTMETPSLIARLLGFGTLSIHTASLGNPIVFDHLAEAQRIQQVILELRDQARDYRMAAQKGQRRRILQKRLGLQKDETEPPIQQPPAPEPKGRLYRFFDYFVPRLVFLKPGEVMWRKHWYILVKKTTVPLLALLFVVSLITALLSPVRLIWGISISLLPYLIALSVLLFLGSLGWLWWNYEDWRNDTYTVTTTSIIDVESAPFGLREQRRVGSLEDVELIYSYIPNFLAKLIKLGDVFIDTAGSPKAYTFESVYDPIAVQREVSSRIYAYRERKSQQTVRAEAERWADWFAEYHGVVSGQGQEEGKSLP